MKKQCQSCGMPLQTKKAYQDGAFIGPDCTLGDMKGIVDEALVRNGSNRLMRWLAQKQLPHLKRWKAQKK